MSLTRLLAGLLSRPSSHPLVTGARNPEVKWLCLTRTRWLETEAENVHQWRRTQTLSSVYMMLSNKPGPQQSVWTRNSSTPNPRCPYLEMRLKPASPLATRSSTFVMTGFIKPKLSAKGTTRSRHRFTARVPLELLIKRTRAS